MECIVLAGGLGTRLRSVTKDVLPKCMAPVNGKPFLHYLFHYLSQQKTDRVIVSLGHKSEAILKWTKKLIWILKWIMFRKRTFRHGRRNTISYKKMQG